MLPHCRPLRPGSYHSVCSQAAAGAVRTGKARSRGGITAALTASGQPLQHPPEQNQVLAAFTASLVPSGVLAQMLLTMVPQIPARGRWEVQHIA